MKMKIAAVAAAVLLSATACGGSPEPEAAPPPAASSAPAETPTPEAEESYDGAGYAAEVQATLLQELNLDSFEAGCDRESWACDVDEITSEKEGRIRIVFSRAIDRAELETLATRAFQLVGEQHPDLEIVQAQDTPRTSLVTIARSEVPTLG